MKRLALACAALALAALPAWRAEGAPSAFALPLVPPSEAPGLVVLQRAITREWGPSDDSTYVEVNVPGERSEGWAMLLSGLVPGSGQLYAGESSGWLFAAIEAGGWIANVLYARRAEDRRDQAEAFAGDPEQAGSNWSFARWESATGGSATDLRALYVADRNAFFQRIGSDPSFVYGWSGVPGSTQLDYRAIYSRFEMNHDRARIAARALLANHVLAAVDALRTMRAHNAQARAAVGMDVNGGWRDGEPLVRVALVRTF